MPLKLNSTGGGSVTLDTPSTASTFTLTVPAITGTAVVTGSTATVSQAMLAAGVAGNGPAFSVYLNADQSVANTTSVKVPFDTARFNLGSCFNTSNGRFTPNVAGYYQFNGTISGSATGFNAMVSSIFFNGNSVRSTVQQVSYGGNPSYISVHGLIYMNGTTDYVELYGQVNGSGSTKFVGGATATMFEGFLARAA